MATLVCVRIYDRVQQIDPARHFFVPNHRHDQQVARARRRDIGDPDGLGIVATLSFFVGSDATGLGVVTSAIGHGIANVVAAGPMIALVERVVTRFSDEEIGRRASLPIGNHRGSLG